MEELRRLAQLLKERNSIDKGISHIINRPAEKGHIGEYIAQRIFKIKLEESAVHKGSDGRFSYGKLRGSTVNVKYYSKSQRMLDLKPEPPPPEYYLVFTGPPLGPVSTRGMRLPFTIEYVFLFDATDLDKALKERGVKIGIATSVVTRLWKEAEIYPTQSNPTLKISAEQRRLLELFR